MPTKKKPAKPADEPATEEQAEEVKDEKDAEPVVVDDRALHSRRPE